MTIKKVIIKKTLKAGKQTWEEGTVLEPPLPPDIQQEIDLGLDTVEVDYGPVSDKDHPYGLYGHEFKPRVIKR